MQLYRISYFSIYYSNCAKYEICIPSKRTFFLYTLLQNDIIIKILFKKFIMIRMNNMINNYNL